MNMEELYRLLRAGHVELQGIVDTISDPLLVLDEALCVRNASRSFFETFRVDRDATIGQRIYELGNGQWDIPELRRLLMEVIPRATAVIDYEVEHEFPEIGRRTMLLTARTLHHPDRTSHSMLLAINDVTDQYRRDAAKDLLFGELRHRMKNLLAVMQSIARQTTTEERTAEEYRDTLLGRFAALVEAQNLAFGEQNKIGLRELLRRVFAPYAARADAILIEPGPDIELDAQTIMSLSLVLHELATNAAKFGGLSSSGGRVHVTWDIDATNAQLQLEWREAGGPSVAPPAKEGYGTKLIQSSIAYGLKGDVRLEYLPEGVLAAMTVPLAKHSAS